MQDPEVMSGMKPQKNVHDGVAAHYNSCATRHAQESGLGVEGIVCPPQSPGLIRMNFIYVEINVRGRSPVPSQMS